MTFDLARPFGDTQTATVAAAMGSNVRVADEQPAPAPDAAGIEEPEEEENAPPA